MAYANKLLLRVKKDKNWWFQFSKKNFRLQLCWDSRKDWFFLAQYAKKAGKKDFMKDFTEILALMEKEGNQPIFTLYELPQILRWGKKK